VNGAIPLLILAAIASAAPNDMVTLAGAYVPAPSHASLRADPLAWQIHEGVPDLLVIQNDSDEDDRLLGGTTPVARCVGVRRTYLENGRRESAPVLEGIVIPAESITTLEPGKSHLAMYGLRMALAQGETFPLTLRFERVGEVTVIARVRRRVDAAGIVPLPEVSLGQLTVSHASAPPAPGPQASHAPAAIALRGWAGPLRHPGRMTSCP
jgi:copper(I)-binding protein